MALPCQKRAYEFEMSCNDGEPISSCCIVLRYYKIRNIHLPNNLQQFVLYFCRYYSHKLTLIGACNYYIFKHTDGHAMYYDQLLWAIRLLIVGPAQLFLLPDPFFWGAIVSWGEVKQGEIRVGLATLSKCLDESSKHNLWTSRTGKLEWGYFSRRTVSEMGKQF